MDKDIAISVKNVSKTFRIPHEKVSSLRGAITSAFKKGGYEEFKALDNVYFEVKKGEFFACLPSRQGIIGKNGSGKSTILKILAGLGKLKEKSLNDGINFSSMIMLFSGFSAIDKNSDYATIESLKPPALTFLRHGGF